MNDAFNLLFTTYYIFLYRIVKLANGPAKTFIHLMQFWEIRTNGPDLGHRTQRIIFGTPSQ